MLQELVNEMTVQRFYTGSVLILRSSAIAYHFVVCLALGLQTVLFFSYVDPCWFCYFAIVRGMLRCKDVRIEPRLRCKSHWGFVTGLGSKDPASDERV